MACLECKEQRWQIFLKFDYRQCVDDDFHKYVHEFLMVYMPVDVNKIPEIIAEASSGIHAFIVEDLRSNLELLIETCFIHNIPIVVSCISLSK